MFSFLNYTDKKYNDTFYIFIKKIGCKMRSWCDVELIYIFPGIQYSNVCLSKQTRV